MPSRSLILLAVLIGSSAGCSDSMAPTAPIPPLPSAPTAPSAPTPPATPTTPVALPSFPALTRPGTVYHAADAELYSSWVGYAMDSRYVLHADGTFVMQFVSTRWGCVGYTGRYTRAGSEITFDWDGWSIAGPWGATGTLDGDALTVRYNLIMALSDFVDGVYTRVPAGT